VIIKQEQNENFRVDLLGKAHDRSNFSCGAEVLDNYFKKYASQDVKKRFAVCFVLTPDGKTVAGFYTLSQYSVELVRLPQEIATHLPKYPVVPATLIGRLAIDQAFRGKKLGEFLLLDALYRSLQQSKQIASYAVIVDAKDEAARSFYEHFQFIPLPDTPDRLFLPMKTIEKLFH